MRKQSKILEDTALWQDYKKRQHLNEERIAWVKKVYDTAANYLKDVRQVFKNYTLHDETHILNVLDAMGGLLGDFMGKLTDGELELLILAASLHDLGMVYTNEEMNIYLKDTKACQAFLRDYRPELFGCESKDWPVDLQQCYLRTKHPFRIPFVLQNPVWKNLFENPPRDIISKRCILAVCQAHGEDAKILLTNENLKYLSASHVDPLFCALLLRLADLLDFDDTRAPAVLYGYTANYEKSRIEWDKHQASAGFRYPETPSVEELPYKARCKNPVIEHSVRMFLDWVDDELDICSKLKNFCNADWQKKFPFPRAVLRDEIESDGYMSGDFCFTLNQEQVLKLLMGENLYDSRDVFVRELLQNAMDATLLRMTMDESFVLNEARINIWNWRDKEGDYWFRIDDQGIGMTLGMVKRYFLQVGNSYYNSKELKRDLLDHGKKEDFHGISHFGIGFLSCFFCGEYAEVSTLYFDPQKNRQESSLRNPQEVRYGLRLQMTDLSGYYVLKNQAEDHTVESPLPMADFYDDSIQGMEESFGYRLQPGTSIVIRLLPGKLGTLNLQESVKKYICGAKVAVYYNGERIGRTYEEAMQIVHKIEGEKIYELDSEMKKKFDKCFTTICGNYPKLVQTVMPLDAQEDQILPGLSGVIVKNKIGFEKKPLWMEKDQNYGIRCYISCIQTTPKVILESYNRSLMAVSENGKWSYDIKWDKLEHNYGLDKTETLRRKLSSFENCPQSVEQLGDVWIPFSKEQNLQIVWRAYVNQFYGKRLEFDLGMYGGVNLGDILGNTQIKQQTYTYQGIVVESKQLEYGSLDNKAAVFFLEGEWKPIVNVNRSKIAKLPLKVMVAMSAIFNKYNFEWNYAYTWTEWAVITLEEWRNVRHSSVGQWIEQNQYRIIEEIKQGFQKRFQHDKMSDSKQIMTKYAIAYLQDNFSMTISYEEGQAITFYDKQKDGYENIYDIFPAFMFCKAADEQSRKYICHAQEDYRRGITVDHPFIIWLLENAMQLKHNFELQFQQLVECLCTKSVEDIIQIYEVIREQIHTQSNRYNMDIKRLPQISRNDFWTNKE